MIKSTFLLAMLLGLVALQPGRLRAQENELWRTWNEPVEPFRIIGNIYYVGAKGIAAYLITGSEGHILIDGGFPETAAIIHANVVKLGFQIEEVEILEGHGVLSRKEGIFAEPTSAAAFAGLARLVDSGHIDSSESVLVAITGFGLKDAVPPQL